MTIQTSNYIMQLYCVTLNTLKTSLQIAPTYHVYNNPVLQNVPHTLLVKNYQTIKMQTIIQDTHRFASTKFNTLLVNKRMYFDCFGSACLIAYQLLGVNFRANKKVTNDKDINRTPQKNKCDRTGSVWSECPDSMSMITARICVIWVKVLKMWKI